MSKWDAGSMGALPGYVWMLAMVGLIPMFGVGALGFWHWNLGAGFVLTALIVAPQRKWPWILLGAIVATSLMGLTAVRTPPPFAALPVIDYSALGCGNCVMYFIGHWADPLLCLLPAWWLQRKLRSLEALGTPDGIALLHVVVLGASLLQTGTDILWVLGEGFVADTRHQAVLNHVLITASNANELLGYFALKNGLGYFLGTMLVLPMTLWLAVPSFRRGSRRMLVEVCLVLLPVVGVFLGLLAVFPLTKLAELLRLLLIASVVIFAVRHGMRGATFSVLVVSVALAAEDHLWPTSAATVWLQMFVAIAGAMALMFGASMDQLRRQTAELLLSRQREANIREELAAASARSVRAQETERGRLSVDLHDSLGQGITALQTELKLTELEGGPSVWIDHLRSTTQQMRRSLREVLEALRPAALVELGLAKAIDQGVIRQTAESAGLAFAFSAHPSPETFRQLDDAVSVAAFRIVQEAVVNAVRHASATTLHVQVRLRRRHRNTWLCVSVTDNGTSTRSIQPGRGIQGIRDRALTLGGGMKYSVRPDGGLRLRAWVLVNH